MNVQRTQKALQLSRFLYDHAKTILFVYVVLNNSRKAQRHVRARGLLTTFRELYIWLANRVIGLALRFPAARQKVETEMEKARIEIEGKLVPQGADVVRHLSLPPAGQGIEWILKEMDTMDGYIKSPNYKLGKLSGAVYHGGDDMEKIIVTAYQRYCVSNPLHPDVFPAVRKMEAEIVAMCLRMYNHPTGAGTMTSGGTESIIMSVKTHRDWARAVKGITEPEIVLPASAHAAFDKGAQYLGIKVHTIPVDPHTRKADMKRIKRAINSNTIMLVGSAVNFPDGNQDDIVALAELARKYKTGLHVDCCLGSFVMPFLEAAGLSNGENGKYKLEPFDFRVPGVTAISCDTHKYGFAPKGTSVIMYRDSALRQYQYYVNPSWTGGVYASPSLSGSRPGALIAGTWAVMQYMGHQGYLDSCKEIVTCARTIANDIAATIPELQILGSPPGPVVAFSSRSEDLNILEVGDIMSKRGWHLNALSQPAALHIACTRLTVNAVDTFLADLKDSVKEAKAAPSGKGTMVTLYGLGNSSAVGPEMVGRVATMFIDTLYKA
ncbi:pyridoxal phosphate-dependent transferase [Pterulicium gracile]|uniref:sphinganine-1-phosphate aldolase n=1 Tax=Pterulicium gracile TaxID=1884261 RepID=A0A5C3R371_9AGAR|nr:pyridoxal phosphate-dependent transferase [Pterula gracilis]